MSKAFTPQASQPTPECVNGRGSPPEGNWTGEESCLPASVEPKNFKHNNNSKNCGGLKIDTAVS